MRVTRHENSKGCVRKFRGWVPEGRQRACARLVSEVRARLTGKVIDYGAPCVTGSLIQVKLTTSSSFT